MPKYKLLFYTKYAHRLNIFSSTIMPLIILDKSVLFIPICPINIIVIILSSLCNE